MKNLILQLGSNNWQRPYESAPGSGLLHEAYHLALNTRQDTRCSSIYPSPMQTSEQEDYKVFRIAHSIPICEGISPVSTYRWHDMSENEFSTYRRRLEREVYRWMEEIEARLGQNFTMMIAHHAFINPLVLRDVNRRRIRCGKPSVPLFCFIHGTALKMFCNELERHPEYPFRFHPLMIEEKIFDEGNVSGCFAVSANTIDVMKRTFPNFPAEKIYLTPCGIDERCFHPREGLDLRQYLAKLGQSLWPGGFIAPGDFDYLLIFAGKFAQWKRIDALLKAAAIYERHLPRLCTLVVGAGPVSLMEQYFAQARKLGLRATFFMGSRDQVTLAELFALADVSVFPSFEEPFGMVFMEAMACGCPVIGVNSGGPREFVSPAVGELVPEFGARVLDPLAKAIAATVQRAIGENWKTNKAPACMDLVCGNYTISQQVDKLLSLALSVIGELDE
uniref:Glycosyltransferase involved in cell wall bisynthesis n=1 Tax=Candidatus Kentrum sp. FW TaxID=2126338 RepID=A0A450TY15_9GAMM|nr:MAG: Glycosyltransferase involved in cell wall bisynthesis [Candidatus Kentron sp. FW]